MSHLVVTMTLTNLASSFQLGRRSLRRTGARMEAGERKVLEVSEVVEVGGAREDEE